MLRFRYRRLVRKRLDELSIIETRYFEKYRDLLNQSPVKEILGKYQSVDDMVFELLHLKISQAAQGELYRQIDDSNFLSPQDKIETILGLMMVFMGMIPEPQIVSRFERVFGKEFVEAIESKRKEYDSEILKEKLIRAIKESHKEKRNR